MDKKACRELLDILKEIRAEVHGNVGNSVIRKLNRAIKKLEAAVEGGKDPVPIKDVLEILTLLGAFVSELPEIVKVIAQLMK